MTRSPAAAVSHRKSSNIDAIVVVTILTRSLQILLNVQIQFIQLCIVCIALYLFQFQVKIGFY